MTTTGNGQSGFELQSSYAGQVMRILNEHDDPFIGQIPYDNIRLSGPNIPDTEPDVNLIFRPRVAYLQFPGTDPVTGLTTEPYVYDQQPNEAAARHLRDIIPNLRVGRAALAQIDPEAATRRRAMVAGAQAIVDAEARAAGRPKSAKKLTPMSAVSLLCGLENAPIAVVALGGVFRSRDLAPENEVALLYCPILLDPRSVLEVLQKTTKRLARNDKLAA